MQWRDCFVDWDRCSSESEWVWKRIHFNPRRYQHCVKAWIQNECHKPRWYARGSKSLNRIRNWLARQNPFEIKIHNRISSEEKIDNGIRSRRTNLTTSRWNTKTDFTDWLTWVKQKREQQSNRIVAMVQRQPCSNKGRHEAERQIYISTLIWGQERQVRDCSNERPTVKTRERIRKYWQNETTNWKAESWAAISKTSKRQ